jgi:hypothetical protein
MSDRYALSASPFSGVVAAFEELQSLDEEN